MFTGQKEKDLYIQQVWEKLQGEYLRVYPFLTDSEFRHLFGKKVTDALARLNCLGEACGRCDLDINCPYYSRKLDRCGIYSYKPVHCRLWHCYDCGPEHVIRDLRELTEIFSDQLGPERQATRIKHALESEQISKEEAESRFKQLIEGVRNDKTVC